MTYPVPPSGGLRGSASLPGDKSISHRALMFGALAAGTSTIQGLSTAGDPASTKSCLQNLGVEITSDGPLTVVRGQGLRGLRKPPGSLDAGNSGTTLRLLSGILAGQNFESHLVGDASLSRRPMKRVMDPLRQMGAHIEGTGNDTAPLRISPAHSLHSITYIMPVASAQVKSAILLAGLYADGTTRVVERMATRDHTERMLGLTTTETPSGNDIAVNGGMLISARDFIVPGDISSAYFLIVAALILPKSEIIINDVGLNPGRTAALDLLRKIGGHIEVVNQKTVNGESIGDIVATSSDLRGNLSLGGAEVAGIIDEIPILAVAMLFTEGSFSLKDAGELRGKESDRIAAIVSNLRLLGQDVEEMKDGFAFQSKKDVLASEIDSAHDHRIAMAFGVAGLRVPGVSIKHAECVDISFPGYWDLLHRLSSNAAVGKGHRT